MHPLIKNWRIRINRRNNKFFRTINREGKLHYQSFSIGEQEYLMTKVMGQDMKFYFLRNFSIGREVYLKGLI